MGNTRDAMATLPVREFIMHASGFWGLTRQCSATAGGCKWSQVARADRSRKSNNSVTFAVVVINNSKRRRGV